ncbi:MAG: hypothetical protein Kow0059_00770 [Candidatus Sumerlaeia bacterium]
MAMSEKDKATLFLGLIIPAIIFGIGWYFDYQLFKPKREGWAKQRVEIDKKMKDLNNELREMNTALAQKDKIIKLRNAVVQRAQRLQTTLDYEGNLRQINRMVTETGIAASEVAPKSYTAQTLYTDFPYDIKGMSRYHEFGLLLNLIELNKERLMRVKSFELRNDKQEPVIHPFDLTLASYVFNREIPEIK